jgi:hypothetical protein
MIRLSGFADRETSVRFVFRTTQPSSLLESSPEGETTLANLSKILKQLKKERAQVERQLWGLDAALRAFANVYTGGKPGRKRRKMSAKSRAKIAAAQRKRWKKVRAKKAA